MWYPSPGAFFSRGPGVPLIFFLGERFVRQLACQVIASLRRLWAIHTAGACRLAAACQTFVQRFVTSRYGARHMTMQLQGRIYFTTAEVLAMAQVSRQTFWRWRSEGKIPAGHRFRAKHLLFTAEDLEIIREHAFRVDAEVARGAP